LNNKFILREVHGRDTPYVKRLWQEVFHDPDEVLGTFFELYIDINLAVVAQGETQLAGMGFLLPVGDLKQPDKPDLQCVMAYAIATAPAFRNVGVGSAITRELLKIGTKHGFGAIVLRPADDGLFGFYEKCGLTTGFYGFGNAPALTAETHGALVRVTPEEYRERREKLLAGITHIAFDRRALTVQERLFGENGGFFFLGDGCVAIDASAGEVVKEYLTPDCGEPRGERFGMANIPLNGGYFGFAFE
jgi:ribosomal protein S18 acetylase RimI-like enzyme